MAENKIIQTYEYYFNILNLMLDEMSNVGLSDIQDLVDELQEELEELEKIEERRKDEMSADKTDMANKSCVY